MSEQVCKNCGNHFEGKYCNVCGEKVFVEKDKSILHFFEEAFHFITHFEGTFFNTVKAIFFRPGKLSLDYCNGIRKKYFKPVPFFMFIVLLYLLFPFFTGLNMPFRFYVQKGNYASRMITSKTGINMDSLIARYEIIQTSKPLSTDKDVSGNRANENSIMQSSPVLEKLESDFNRKSEKTSKILLLILLPLTALVNWILSFRKRKYFFDHLVLATEQNSFYLLFTFFLIPFFILLSYKIVPGIARNGINEMAIGIVSYAIFGIYCAASFRRFYGGTWLWAMLKTIIFILAHIIIVQIIYKFILFCTTFYLT